MNIFTTCKEELNDVAPRPNTIGNKTVEQCTYIFTTYKEESNDVTSQADTIGNKAAEQYLMHSTGSVD